MAEVPGVTVCPHCSAPLVPDPVDYERPVQTMHQCCEECEYETTVAVLWIPENGYDVIGTVDDERRCEQTPSSLECGRPVTYAVVDNISTKASYYCESCLRAHHESAIETAHKVVE